MPKPKKSRPDPVYEARRARLVVDQRAERGVLRKSQEQRRVDETRARQARLPRGLTGIVARATGRIKKIERALAEEAQRCNARDAAERQALVNSHLDAHQQLRREARQQGLSANFDRLLKLDPRQTLVMSQDDVPHSRDELLRNPSLVLEHISHSKARFNRKDIARALSKKIEDADALCMAVETALQAPDLVALDDGQAFTTKDYQSSEAQLLSDAACMAQQTGFGVATCHTSRALAAQNEEMSRAFGSKLSAEQSGGLDHILNGPQLVNLVGLG